MLFVGRSKTAGVTVVELYRRPKESGEKIGVPAGTAFARFEGVVVGGKESYPPL